ncbi:MAG TPA: Hpt domain-containing protein, partial [Gemmatimonadaceae bacterium]
MDSTQYAELFLTESREHVSAINHALLALERGEGVREAVDAVFRAVHTVKGMSATMGYRVVADLSHELETLLDRARRRQGLVRPEVVELLFRAADALEQSIEGAVAGAPPPAGVDDLLGELRAAGGAVTPPVGQVAVGSPGGWTAPLPPGPGLAVRVKIAPETPLRGVRAFLVLQAVKRIGDVLATSPGIEAIQAERFGQDFAFRLDTTHTEIEVESAVRGAGDVADVRIGADPASRASRGTPMRGMPIVPAAEPSRGAGAPAVPPPTV